MTSSPHDLLFEGTFSVVEIAEGELRSMIPAELAAAIDWRTLKHEPGSFVDAELKESHTDLLFSANLGQESIREAREASVSAPRETFGAPQSFRGR